MSLRGRSRACKPFSQTGLEPSTSFANEIVDANPSPTSAPVPHQVGFEESNGEIDLNETPRQETPVGSREDRRAG